MADNLSPTEIILSIERVVSSPIILVASKKFFVFLSISFFLIFIQPPIVNLIEFSGAGSNFALVYLWNIYSGKKFLVIF